MRDRRKVLAIAIGTLCIVFFAFLYTFPTITFFILLAFSTVFVAKEPIDKYFPEKVKTLVILAFCFSLYGILALFIFLLTSLVQKVLILNPKQVLSSYPQLYAVLSYIKSNLNLPTLTSKLGEIAGYSIIYPVLTFFLLKEIDTLKKAVFSFIPNPYFEMCLNLFYHINKKLKAYFKGLVIETLVYSLVCTVGSSLVVPKYSIVFGLIGGIANIIPFLGTLFNYALFGVLFFVFKGIKGALIGVLTITAAQVIDMVVYPFTYSKVLSLPSSIIIISVLLWGKVFGIIGMILAVPLTTVLYAVLVEFGKTLKHY